MISYRLFQTGYCTHNAKIALKGEASYTMKFPAMTALLEHPDKGYLLFDTGYTDAFYQETKKFPFSLYAKITPVFVAKEDSVAEQLKQQNIQAADINYIFLSHFHADHMCGLKDFPNSTFICSKEAYYSVRNKRGIQAVLSAYIPNLLPADFEERVVFIEDFNVAQVEQQPFQAISEVFEKPLYDLWGDGSCMALNLSGHAKGQFGLVFQDPREQTVFLAADAVWRSKSFRENRPPSKLAHLIMDNPYEYQSNFDKIVRLHSIANEINIIPSHCEEPFLEQRGTK